MNLPKKVLTSEEEDVLGLGLNFAPAPMKLSLLDIAAAIEVVAKKMDGDEASDLHERKSLWFHEKIEGTE